MRSPKRTGPSLTKAGIKPSAKKTGGVGGEKEKFYEEECEGPPAFSSLGVLLPNKPSQAREQGFSLASFSPIKAVLHRLPSKPRLFWRTPLI